jgi:transposase-like protein
MKNQKSASLKIGGREISPRELGEYFLSQGCHNYEEVSSHLKELVKPTLQGLLDAELENHLGYPKNHVKGNHSGNSRNGYRNRKLRTESGEIDLEIPRDRNGSFETETIKNYQKNSHSLDDQIIRLYAKGNSTQQISNFAEETYGVNVSGDMVSAITDKVLPLVEEWQNRPLSRTYPIVFLDGIHHKVREGGKIVSKCAYIALGINPEGIKEVLGIYVGENESAKFWMGVLQDLKHRGLEDILIACTDNLSGFSESIKAIYPKTEIQKCIVHQIRNTVKFIPYKEKKKFCSDLRAVYTAVNDEVGLKALGEVKEKWPDYAVYLNSWEKNWGELSTFFAYPEEIRKVIYTTNSIESLNRQFRAVTKTTVIFPHDQALKKLLWLAQEDISKKWNSSIKDWGKIAAQFSIFFPDRFIL